MEIEKLLVALIDKLEELHNLEKSRRDKEEAEDLVRNVDGLKMTFPFFPFGGEPLSWKEPTCGDTKTSGDSDPRDTLHKMIVKMLEESPTRELERVLNYMTRNERGEPTVKSFSPLEKDFVLEELRRHQQGIFELERENERLQQRLFQLESNQWRFNQPWPWPVYVGTGTPLVPTFGTISTSTDMTITNGTGETTTGTSDNPGGSTTGFPKTGKISTT